MGDTVTTVALREVTQTILYDAEREKDGIFGNCLQAALASALDMHLDAVPNFAAFTWWDAAARLWLRGIGFDWRQQPAPPVPEGRSVVVGRSPRPTGLHAVVGDAARIVWDPHPDRSGLTEAQRAYVLERWPTSEPSGCVICGSRV